MQVPPFSPLLLFDEYAEVVYITYTMATRDLPDIYALARGAAQGRGHIYQANPSWPWYNYYIKSYMYSDYFKKCSYFIVGVLQISC